MRLLALLTLAAGPLVGCGERDPSPHDPIFRDPAARLAALDAGHLRIKPAQLLPYRAELDALAPRCTELPHELPDIAVTGAEQWASRSGERVTTLDMLRALRAAVPPGSALVSCSTTAAFIVAAATAGAQK